MEMTRIGLDLAKNVFEVFGVDDQEHFALRKTLKRNQMMKLFAQLKSHVATAPICYHCWV
ncbi:hypothetical protein QKW35_08280 [Pontibacterium granulatum]|uniref:hypothetical protein n=1 Tax=Pontibacterium granulatum TaxID=2036029 RepID=UPI00249AD5BF|nr:hypothetical protein [Pontibacterium granulatum]MDI3324370.1 hypothetical protein [Pontibacterium granulatum]